MSSETSAASQTGTAVPDVSPPALPGKSAGTLLREARDARGMTLEAVAALLKVPVRKLEALEEDRHADLQGPAFVRALALSACRVMKADATPVLALLPQVQDNALDHVSAGINKTFQDPAYARDWRFMLHEQRGVLALMAVFALGALALWMLPDGWVDQLRTPAASAAQAASGVVEEAPPQPVPAPLAEPIASDRLPPAAASSALLATPLVPASAPTAAAPGVAGGARAPVPTAGTVVTLPRPALPASGAAARWAGAGASAPRAASAVRWSASGVRPVAAPAGRQASGASGNAAASGAGGVGQGGSAPVPAAAPSQSGM